MPRATPLPGDGQPVGVPAELSLGASNLGEIMKPTAGDPDTGVAVPGVQLLGALALRVTRNFSMTAIYEHGLASTATPVKSSEPPINNGDVIGGGVGWAYSIETSTPGFRVGLANAIVLWSTPWIQYTSCVSNCAVPGATSITLGSSTVPSIAFAVVPSYRTGRFTVFGGVTARNHPTITEKIDTNLPTDPDVMPGPLNFIIHAGASVALGRVRMSVVIHQDLNANPVRYGPGVGALITLPLALDNP